MTISDKLRQEFLAEILQINQYSQFQPSSLDRTKKNSHFSYNAEAEMDKFKKMYDYVFLFNYQKFHGETCKTAIQVMLDNAWIDCKKSTVVVSKLAPSPIGKPDMIDEIALNGIINSYKERCLEIAQKL